MKNLKPFQVPGTFLDNTNNPPITVADACVLGIAFDATASYNKGAWFGPNAIMAASHQIEYEVPVFGVPLTDKVKIHSVGVLEYPRQLKEDFWIEWADAQMERLCKKMVSDVEEVSNRILKQKKLLVGFGGEHSTANGIFRALAKNYNPKEVTILHLDAHLDMREELDGSEYSHGSVIKRALDLGFQTIHLGIRDHISAEEAETIQSMNLSDRIFPCPTMPKTYYKKKSAIFKSPNFLWNGIFSPTITKNIVKKIRTPFAYFSIDVDAFDPAHFPGTGTPLPFGLDFSSTQDFFYALLVEFKKNDTVLLGFDIQEVSPQLEKNAKQYNALQTMSTQTEMNAALLAYKILLWQFLDRF